MLFRSRFGIINLPPRLKRGMTAELGEVEVVQVLDWVGLMQDGNKFEQVSSSSHLNERASSEKVVRRSAPTPSVTKRTHSSRIKKR